MAKEIRKYADYTAEEKAEYKAKRDAWIAKRKADKEACEKELENAINALPFVTNELQIALENFKAGAKSSTRATSSKESYMHKVFDTETPKSGTVVTFAFIGMRGADGSRLAANESTAGDLVKRTGDVKFLYSATDINQMVWYLNKYGNEVLIDKDKMTVTFIADKVSAGSKASVDEKSTITDSELKAQLKASGFEQPVDEDDDDDFEDYEDDDDEDPIL